MALGGQPETLVFVLILRLRNRRHYPIYYRPAPLDVGQRDLWRFVPGMLQGEGYPDVKDAQAGAVLLGRQLQTLHHSALGALDVRPENIILDLVVDVPWLPEVIALPPFGFGRKTLRQLLEEGGRTVARHEKNLIIAPVDGRVH